MDTATTEKHQRQKSKTKKPSVADEDGKIDLEELLLDYAKPMREQIKAMSFDKEFKTESEEQQEFLDGIRKGIELNEKVRGDWGYKFMQKKKPSI